MRCEHMGFDVLGDTFLAIGGLQLLLVTCILYA